MLIYQQHWFDTLLKYVKYAHVHMNMADFTFIICDDARMFIHRRCIFNAYYWY